MQTELASKHVQSHLELLHHWAIAKPDAIFATQMNRQYTFRQVAQLVLQFEAALRHHGLQEGDIVGIQTGNPPADLCLTLACEAIGAVSISLYRQDLARPSEELRRCNALFVEQEPSVEVARQITGAVHSFPAFQTLAVAAPPAASLESLQRETDSNRPLRIIRSSGTTGDKKCMAMTRRQISRCVELESNLFGIDTVSGPDFYVPYGLALRAAYLDSMLGLSLGRRIDFGYLQLPIPPGRHHMMLSVGDIAAFIASRPSGAEPLPMSIGLIAGKVPAKLLSDLRKTSDGKVLDIYSSNETHWIAETDSGGPSRLLPGVDIRIVDGEGRRSPEGENGFVEVKTNRSVSAYLWNEATTREYFSDGWFRTFDWGHRNPDGTLVILGRADGMLNVGGMKIAPGPIEERLNAIEGLTGTCLFVAPDPSGVDRLHVVAESTRTQLGENVINEVQAIVSPHAFEFQIHTMEKMPRTETGKVRVIEVQEAVLRRT